MNRFETLTKKELVEKLEELTHLAEAIEVKDSEIFELNKELNELKRFKIDSKKQSEIEKAELTALLKNEFKKERDILATELQELRNKLQQIPNLDYVSRLEKDNVILTNSLNKYIHTVINYLKSQQANL